MRNLSTLLGLIILGLGFGAGVARSESLNQFCSAADLRSCSALGTEECLQKYYACGMYDAVIQHYAGETLGSSLDARYFKGVSYYGLFVRNRAQSLKCRFAAAARIELAAFTQKGMKDSNLANPQEMDRIYQASKIVGELKRFTGCVEQAWTVAELQSFAAQYADEKLKTIFLASSSKDGMSTALKTMRETIQYTISGFVVKAAQAETQLALREEAITVSNRRLDEIREILDRAFGKVVLTQDDKGQIIGMALTLGENSTFIRAQGMADSLYQEVTDLMGQLNASLDSMNIADYEKSRENFVATALASLTKGQRVLDIHEKINKAPRTQLDIFLGFVDRATDAASFPGILQEIRETWAANDVGQLECMGLAKKPWFCDAPTAMFEAILPSTGALK